MDRILIVDDDTTLCGLLLEYMGREGFDVEFVHDGEQGLKIAGKEQHDLVVLDVMLPRGNGFEVLNRLRARTGIPVVMLTARGEEIDRVVGLEMGADDYLVKPFNPRELVARIRAVLRRARMDRGGKTPAGMPVLEVGDMTLHSGRREARRSGNRIELTAVEFDLLELLMRNAGQVVPREEMNSKVLGRTLSPYDRSIDVHVSRLRKKLGHEVSDIERIRSIRGSGYLYALTAKEGGG